MSRVPPRVRQLAAAVRHSRAVARREVARARTGIERHVIARRAAPGVPAARILCYHSVGTPECGVNDVTPRSFARHIEAALEAGHRFVPAAELVDAPPHPSVADRRLALTFDDGLRSVLANAAPVLRDLGVPWTAFVVTDWAEGRHPFRGDVVLDWAGIEALAGFGATIGSHSVTHPDFGRLGAGRAADELGGSRVAIRERLGIDVTEFAIPFGQSRNWTADAGTAAAGAGYRTVYAQSALRRPAGTVPRTFISRFDTPLVFSAALGGAFDGWEEWV